MVTVTSPVTTPDTSRRTYLTFASVTRGAISWAGGAPWERRPGFQAPMGLNSTPSELPSTTIGPVNDPRHKKQVSISDPVGGTIVDVSTTGVRPLAPAARLAMVPNPFSPAPEIPDTSQVTPTAPVAPDRRRTELKAPGTACSIPSGPPAPNEATDTNVCPSWLPRRS
jgi:hypothetical protein